MPEQNARPKTSLQGRLPAVSMIVAAYNVAEYIEAALASLRAQTFSDFEAIVIDDGSNDGTADKIRQATSEDSRFRLVSQANKGLSAARNLGLDIARGDIIGFLDGDDRLRPVFLESLIGALQSEEFLWASCGVLYCHKDGREVSHPARYSEFNPQSRSSAGSHGSYPLATWTDAIAHYPSAWNKLYRRQLIEGLRFPEGLLYEDHEFYLEAAARTDRIASTAAPLYMQTMDRPGQITSDGSRRVFQQFEALERLSHSLDGRKPFGDHAYRQLSARLLWERSKPISDHAIEAEFLSRARTLIASDPRLGVLETPADVPLSWRRVMAGENQMSIHVSGNPNGEGLEQTRRSIEHQTLCGIEVETEQPIHKFVESASGRYLLCLSEGDTLCQSAAETWCAEMDGSAADVGLIGGPAPLVQNGPSIIRRSALQSTCRDGASAGIQLLSLVRPDARIVWLETPANALVLARTQKHSAQSILRRAWTLERFGAEGISGFIWEMRAGLRLHDDRLSASVFLAKASWAILMCRSLRNAAARRLIRIAAQLNRDAQTWVRRRRSGVSQRGGA